MTHIAILSADPAMFENFSSTSAGYDLERLSDPDAAFQSLLDCQYDLVIIEVDGWQGAMTPDFMARIRAGEFCKPVIIISKSGACLDKVNWLDAGADDYMIQPVYMGELGARIRARLRRS